MSTMITEECINCGACEPECPNTAIYEGGVEWESAMSALEMARLNDTTVDEREHLVKQATVVLERMGISGELVMPAIRSTPSASDFDRKTCM